MNNTAVSENQSLEGILLYPTTDDDFDHQFICRNMNILHWEAVNDTTAG